MSEASSGASLSPNINNVYAGSSSGHQSNASQATFVSTISQEKEQLKWDADKELKRTSKMLLKMQKWSLSIGLLVINGVLIWVAVHYPQAYYLSVKSELFMPPLSCLGSSGATLLPNYLRHSLHSEFLADIVGQSPSSSSPPTRLFKG